MKPTSFDAIQFKTLYLDLLGGGQATAPVLVTPATPQELEATAISSASIYLEWSSTGENTTNYLIESSTDGITYTQIATVAVGITVYTDTGLTFGTLYYYRVRASSSSSYSPYSNVASATTLSYFAAVLDDFNRADESPLDTGHGWAISPNWCKIVSNQAVSIISPSSGPSKWGTTYGPNCEVWAVIGTIVSSTSSVVARQTGPSSTNGYRLDLGSGGIFILLAPGGATLYSGSVSAPVSGSAIGIRCVGTTIHAFYRATSLSAWTEVTSVVDSTYTGAGGIVMRIDSGTFTTFGGGDI